MRRERDGLLKNIEEFRQVAERMTGAFSDLERRFTQLEERLPSQPALMPDDAEATPARP